MSKNASGLLSTVPVLIDVKTFKDARGHLGVIEAVEDTGFMFRRLYFSYNNTDGVGRGAHAHKELQQLMIAINGAFDITLKGGGETFDFRLSGSAQALYIPPGYWRDITNFSEAAVCLVAASDIYRPDDYIHSYEEFLIWEKAI